ncbi:MAG: hypothetical protein HFI03_16575 [Lachnospiraceae bacterium]|nr:hypothetical protein [Lachnospiraceae bacterium]
MRMDSIKGIKAEWEKQPEAFPVFLEKHPEIFPAVGDMQKKENEALIEEFSARMQKKAEQRPEGKEGLKQWEQEMEQELKCFLKKEKMLSLSEWINPVLFHEFEKETKHFIDRVRGFDADLNAGQIWQAMRNYFIYAMIVEMQGERQNAANPILAYSLLYPYTDNYIDDKTTTKEEKERYNRMIARKLKGEPVLAQSALEEKTCRLLDMIGDAYEGEAKKKVIGTLLQLLEAQNYSIRQQKAGISEDEILGISIWKGSTSVLADYLFATQDWREKEEGFYLRFGFLLQLVDDLQDMEEDKKEGSHTLMIKAAEQKRLEGQVNRLLWFIWDTVRAFEPRNPGLKGFVLKNCVEITLLSVAMSAQHFLKEYIKALEPYLPLSVEFIKKMKKQQKKGKHVQGMFISVMEEKLGKELP